MPRRSRTDAREHVVAEWLLAAVAIVLTAAVIGSSLLGRSDRAPAPPAGDPPAAAPAPAPGGPGNGSLVADPGFEAGLAGWRPIGEAPMERAAPGRGGRWAASFTADRVGDQGMALVGVVRGVPGYNYAATLWVQATRPGALLQVNLLEVVAGQRFAVDSVGEVLAGGGWQRVEVNHDAHQPGASLVLELVLPKGTPRSTILVDDLQLVARKGRVLLAG